MKTPMPPPDLSTLLNRLQQDKPRRLLELLTRYRPINISQAPYLPWDELRFRAPPEGFDVEEWWLATRLRRNSVLRQIPLADVQGEPFAYALPDEVLRLSEEITRNASGQISISEQVTDHDTRDRYLISSLIEEAITSSQLEGASTERSVAKEMLRSGREPVTVSERMIVNNYHAMTRIGELRDEELTPELICEIHRIVTEGTLENPAASGRFQSPDEERINVLDETDKLLHRPPPAELLPERMAKLCDFANGETGSAYLPPVLRALTIHFMIGYEHPFEDGNGRTARTLFYWSMLNQGFWLTEFLTVSKILRKAPARYARSFLHTEQDTNDLTYFFLYHLDVLKRAIEDLQQHLSAKMEEARLIQQSLATLPGEFNHRQVAVLDNAVKNPGQNYTARSHGRSHRVSEETARKDLGQLEERGFLLRVKAGKKFAWLPAPGLVEKLSK
ncbi:Fic family protein [Amycolatopsis magusensis]|uniref:Fic family protein n=1 Tax=Amycolatopsis magusensis TaxID=882444 RepID=A0ABS4PIF7_9PSEU|nr:Fic family protein [Amycolatopsis magusensis]MBP2179204.1 Fic family protein [Amycolatopsis magusensis]MDI5981510.1 Fic family protein [Amycolatopsis magusensis]